MERNSEDRVLAALYSETPDSVPWFELGYDSRILREIFGKELFIDVSAAESLLKRSKAAINRRYLTIRKSTCLVAFVDEGSSASSSSENRCCLGWDRTNRPPAF